MHANQHGVTGTNSPVEAYPHARVIQQVIEGDVTLAEAWWFHEQLTINRRVGSLGP